MSYEWLIATLDVIKNAKFRCVPAKYKKSMTPDGREKTRTVPSRPFRDGQTYFDPQDYQNADCIGLVLDRAVLLDYDGHKCDPGDIVPLDELARLLDLSRDAMERALIQCNDAGTSRHYLYPLPDDVSLSELKHSNDGGWMRHIDVKCGNQLMHIKPGKQLFDLSNLPVTAPPNLVFVLRKPEDIRPDRTVKTQASPADVRYIRRCLEHITLKDGEYSKWQQIIAGVVDSMGVTTEAHELLDSWSATQPGYMGGGDVWTKMTQSPPGGGTTMGTVAWLAQQGGADTSALYRETHGLPPKQQQPKQDTGVTDNPFFIWMDELELSKMSLPDVQTKKNRDGTHYAAPVQWNTTANLRYVLDAYGLTLRFNMQHGEPEAWYRGRCVPFTSDAYLPLITQLYSIFLKLGINCRSSLHNDLEAFAREDTYNPADEWIKSLTWTGEDAISALANTVKTDNPLWHVYLRKWLIQAVEAMVGWQGGDSRSLPYVLTFSGAQGIGKSHFFKCLVKSEFFTGEAGLHLNTFTARDNMVHVLSTPITELGELDTTFGKSAVGALKAFISAPFDSIRLPYARAAIKRKRCTAFCATVNDRQFLQDETGSRRYWVVAVDSFDWEHSVDLEQVWAQACHLWSMGDTWHLTAEETTQQQASNQEHQSFHPAYERMVEFLDRLNWHGNTRRQGVARDDLMEAAGIGLHDTFGIRMARKAVVARTGKIANMVRDPHWDKKVRGWHLPLGAEKHISAFKNTPIMPKIATDMPELDIVEKGDKKDE